MLKFLSRILNGLFSPTAGDHLKGLKAKAEAGYNAGLSKVEKVYADDLAVVEAVAHRELDALQHVVAHAQERMHALLSAEVDLGDRNGDAAVLHHNLTKAVGQ